MTTATPVAPRPATAQERGAPPAGTGTLVRLILRRDRVRLPAWLIGIAGFIVVFAATMPDIYPTAADRQARADLLVNPAGRAMSGPAHGVQDYTFGAMLANEYLGYAAIFAGLMSILLVVRHTRAEEVAGRAELVRAAVVGRHATTTATLIVVGTANLVLGALVALGVGSLGLEGVGWASSWLFGAALAAVGVVFAAVAALTAQLTEHSRGAAGMAGAGLALAYTVRAAGDMGDGTLSWLSPIGWVQATRVYVDDRWWPLLLTVLSVVVILAMAFWLEARRDVGAGLVRPRPGPAVAAKSLGSPLGLAWRLHRPSLIWWIAALGLFGLVYGSLTGAVEDFIEDSGAVQDFFAVADAAILDGFLAMVAMMVAMATAVFAVLAVQRLRGEETAVRAEPVLATAVSRSRWMASHLVVAMAGSAGVLLLGVLGVGISAAAVTGDFGVVPALLGAGLVQLPAIWVFIGLAAAVFGVSPRAVLLVWAVLVYAMTVGVLGGMLGLPEWTHNLSPFGHVPMLPAESLSWAPLVILTAVATVLLAVGLYGFRRRDVTTTA
jgi:ABC-2 type transport system permease protein